MSARATIATTAVLLLASWAWWSQLLPVSRPARDPRPLVVRTEEERTRLDLDVVLPAVPAGHQHLRSGDGVLLIHYWAPWQRHGAAQAALLDSLRRVETFERLRVVVVCFDPFPSVARFVARQRLRLNVLLDGDRRLREALPCLSVPFTYVIDPQGRVAVAQAGEVDWLAEDTREGLSRLLEEASPTGTPRASWDPPSTPRRAIVACERCHGPVVTRPQEAVRDGGRGPARPPDDPDLVCYSPAVQVQSRGLPPTRRCSMVL